MITSYEYTDPEKEKWHLTQTAFGSINLIVGATGCGKTRFLRTLFNFCRFITNADVYHSGLWKLTISAGGYNYEWILETQHSGGSQEKEIINELLIRKTSQNIDEEKILIERTKGSLKYCGETLPKLPKDKSGVWLFKEEELIQPLYQVFARGLRREFHGDALSQASRLMPISSSEMKNPAAS